MVVAPALSVNAKSVPDDLSSICASVQTAIISGRATGLDAVNLKLMGAVMSGSLSQSPVLLGFLLAAVELLEKKSRGIDTLAGRHSLARTETEKALLADAALTLAIETGNKRMAKLFGIPASHLKIPLDSLLGQSLPCPGLALFFEDILEQNLNMSKATLG